MKTPPILIVSILSFLILPVTAAVVQTPGNIAVQGLINGDGSDLSVKGDTLDFLKFEILTTSNLTVYSEFGTRGQLWLAGFVGDDLGFDYIGISEPDLRIPYGESKAFPLGPGIYVAVFGIRDEDDNQFYSEDRGFVPVNPLGGGFTNGPYAYSLRGDIRALEFWDGELDNTFIITRFEIPEPAAPLLAAMACTALLLNRRRKP